MAKLKTDPISQVDLIEFLDGHSDFSFEVQVLRELISRGFECDHGGTYDDPATNKPREFDIRATKVLGRRFLRLAVECKNLRPHFPVLVTCLPRREEEAFHEIAYSVDPEKNPIEEPEGPYSIAMLPTSKNIRLAGKDSLYPPGGPVGKSCDQVGRTEAKGEIAAGDGGIYEKWAQALSSADDLTYLACTDGKERTASIALSLVIPVLVVPNGQLWQALYDDKGVRMVDPIHSDRCSYFVGKRYYHRSLTGDELTLSHLEIVTLAGLLQLIDELCGDEDAVNKTFPIDRLAEAMREGLSD